MHDTVISTPTNLSKQAYIQKTAFIWSFEVNSEFYRILESKTILNIVLNWKKPC